MNATIVDTNILIYRNEIEKDLKKKGFLDFGMSASDRYKRFNDQEPIFMICPSTLNLYALKFSKEDRRFKSQTLILVRPIDVDVPCDLKMQIKAKAKVMIDSGELFPKVDFRVLKRLAES